MAAVQADCSDCGRSFRPYYINNRPIEPNTQRCCVCGFDFRRNASPSDKEPQPASLDDNNYKVFPNQNKLKQQWSQILSVNECNEHRQCTTSTTPGPSSHHECKECRNKLQCQTWRKMEFLMNIYQTYCAQTAAHGSDVDETEHKNDDSDDDHALMPPPFQSAPSSNFMRFRFPFSLNSMSTKAKTNEFFKLENLADCQHIRGRITKQGGREVSQLERSSASSLMRGSSKQWKLRYLVFCADAKQLHIFGMHDCGSNGHGDSLQYMSSIALRNICVIQRAHLNTLYDFELREESGKIWRFRAQSKSDMTQWMQCIQQAHNTLPLSLRHLFAALSNNHRSYLSTLTALFGRGSCAYSLLDFYNDSVHIVQCHASHDYRHSAVLLRMSCDANRCVCLRRHRRDRSRDRFSDGQFCRRNFHTCNDDEIEWINVLDRMHCFIFHRQSRFSSGTHIGKADEQHGENENDIDMYSHAADGDDDAADASTDKDKWTTNLAETENLSIFNDVSYKRRKYETPQHLLKEYSVGQKMNYCYRSYTRYDNLKDELLAKGNFSPDIWNIELKLAKKKVLESKKVYQRACNANNDHYQFRFWNRMRIEHILALVFYCNYDWLCFEFRKSFRVALNTEEERQRTIDQHYAEWYWFGRFLYEAVEFYGKRMEKGKRYYFGVDSAYVLRSTKCELFQPTSTSSELAVAENFASKNGRGIVFELGTQFVHESVRNETRFMDCGWISIFPEEEECLFFGYCNTILITSIRVWGDLALAIVAEKLAAFDFFSEQTSQTVASCICSYDGRTFQGWIDLRFQVNAINYWAKISTGYAGHSEYNVRVDKRRFSLKKTQQFLADMIEFEVSEWKTLQDIECGYLRYVQQLFHHSVFTKTGRQYQSTYLPLYDVDFRNIRNEKLYPCLRKHLLIDADCEDKSKWVVDANKIKAIYPKATRYVDQNGNLKQLSNDNRLQNDDCKTEHLNDCKQQRERPHVAKTKAKI